MAYEHVKRRREEEECYAGRGRGRVRNFGQRIESSFDTRNGREESYSRHESLDRYERRDSKWYNENDHNRSNGHVEFNGRDRDRDRDRSEDGRNYRTRGRGGVHGAFRGGHGGGFGSNEEIHKPAGGDFARKMPDSTKYQQLVPQPMANGTVGTPIQLIGNFYQVLHSDIKVHHYNVDIAKVPSKKPDTADSNNNQKKWVPPSEERIMSQERFIKKFADKIVDGFVSSNPEIFKEIACVYDGWKNAYTAEPLVFSGEVLSKIVEIDIDGRMVPFRVTLRLVDRVSLGDAVEYYERRSKKPISERIISVFEVIIRFVIGKTYSAYQRKFFDIFDVDRSPKAKLVDFVQGFISSMRQTEFGLALNIHLKTSTTISKVYERLLPLVCDILGHRDPEDLTRGLDQRMSRAVNRIIKHLKIETRHGNRRFTYTADGLADKFPDDCKFSGNDGKIKSATSYFKEEYGLQLMPLPMVRALGKRIYLPLELCFLKEAQFLNKNKLDLGVQRELLFKSTHTPNVYFNKVAKIVSRIKESDMEDGVLKQFGMDLIPKAAQFQGRVLPAPRNLNGFQRDAFFNTCKVPPLWGVFCLDKRPNESSDWDAKRLADIGRFAAQMADNALRFGLNLGPPICIERICVSTLKEVHNVFHNLNKKTNIELIFVGIPNQHELLVISDIYNVVKQACDQQFGIMSQCFKADFLNRTPNGYFDNFLLKVNGKIGGQNSALDPHVMEALPFNPSRTMMIGIDVNHPSPDSGVMSSVAAAVGSYDRFFSRYNATICVQRKERDEMVHQLNEMVADLLFQYNKENNCFPENVIVFRDGVSEQQFNKVIEAEIPLIRQACSDVGHPVKLIVIVVQKRHHTRFALAEQNTSGRKPTWNVPSGTVVDNAIVDPNYRAFYLNSHFSPLGTSKPSKYVILLDELKLSPDEVQKLCFYSCYNSIRTRNVIAIPTAVRYADLLAYRSKMHLEAHRAQDGHSTHSSSSGGKASPVTPEEEEKIIRKLNEQAKLHEGIKNRLFYC